MAHKFRHGDIVCDPTFEVPGRVVGVSDDGTAYRVAWDKRASQALTAVSHFLEVELVPHNGEVNLARDAETEDALEYYSVVSGFDGKG